MIKKLLSLFLIFALTFNLFSFSLTTIFASDDDIETEDEIEDETEIEIEVEDGEVKIRVDDFDLINTEDDINPLDFDDGTQLTISERCASFEDLEEIHPLCKYLATMRRLGVTSPNLRFRPFSPITRGQFAAMDVRAFEMEIPEDCDLPEFVDVDVEYTFYTDIRTLQCLELLNGVEVDGELYFYPERPITRGQTVKIIANQLEIVGEIELEEEPDVDLDTEFEDGGLEESTFGNYFKKVLSENDTFPEPIVKGFSDHYLRPNRPLTRLQAIVLIARKMRAMDRLEDLDEIDFLENDDDEMEEIDMVIDMENYSFSDNLIDVEAGEDIKVRLVNKGGFHNFVIDELGVQSRDLLTGQSTIVEIEVPEDAAGEEYQFYCGIGNHRELGMFGTLRVLPHE